MIKSILVLSFALLVVGFGTLASATPRPVAPSSGIVKAPDFPAVSFATMGSVDLTPRPRFHALASKPRTLTPERAMQAPMRCGPVHENGIGGHNSDCTLDL
jgi:hypothetical protein